MPTALVRVYPQVFERLYRIAGDLGKWIPVEPRTGESSLFISRRLAAHRPWDVRCFSAQLGHRISTDANNLRRSPVLWPSGVPPVCGCGGPPCAGKSCSCPGRTRPVSFAGLLVQLAAFERAASALWTHCRTYFSLWLSSLLALEMAAACFDRHWEIDRELESSSFYPLPRGNRCYRGSFGREDGSGPTHSGPVGYASLSFMSSGRCMHSSPPAYRRWNSGCSSLRRAENP